MVHGVTDSAERQASRNELGAQRVGECEPERRRRLTIVPLEKERRTLSRDRNHLRPGERGVAAAISSEDRFGPREEQCAFGVGIATLVIDRRGGEITLFVAYGQRL